MPLMSIRLGQIEDALLELSYAKLIHLFDVGSRRYLVFHDHQQWNPPSNLKYAKGIYASPPPGTCICCKSIESNPDETALVSSSSSSTGLRGVQGGEGASKAISGDDEIMRQLFDLAKKQSVMGREDTIRAYLIGWKRRLGGADKLQEKLMDPWVVGKTVIEIQEWLFPKVAQKPMAPAVKTFKCAVCNDTGKVVGGFLDGAPVMNDCSCRRRAARA